jgi:hypothetical protein
MTLSFNYVFNLFVIWDKKQQIINNIIESVSYLRTYSINTILFERKHHHKNGFIED